MKTRPIRSILAVLALAVVTLCFNSAPAPALVENQSFGVFGVTPVTAQPSGSAQAAVSQTQDALTDSTGGTAGTTLAAITAGSSYAQADAVATKNALATLAAELAKVKADVAASQAQGNAIRTALVNEGLIKGSN